MEVLDRQRLSDRITAEVYGFMLEKINEAVDSEPEVRLLMLEVIERIVRGAICSMRTDVLMRDILGEGTHRDAL